MTERLAGTLGKIRKDSGGDIRQKSSSRIGERKAPMGGSAIKQRHRQKNISKIQGGVKGIIRFLNYVKTGGGSGEWPSPF